LFWALATSYASTTEFRYILDISVDLCMTASIHVRTIFAGECELGLNFDATNINNDFQIYDKLKGNSIQVCSNSILCLKPLDEPLICEYKW
jgi:hypothetical protein